MSQEALTYYLIKQDKIPILLDYFRLYDPTTIYTFDVMNATSRTLWFKPRADIPYSSSIVQVGSGARATINLTLNLTKKPDLTDQTFNVYLDICSDSACSSIIQTDQFPVTVYWRKLTSINIINRFTFDDGTTQNWGVACGTCVLKVSDSSYITPNYSLLVNYPSLTASACRYTLSSPAISTQPLNDVFLAFLALANQYYFRKFSIYIDNELRSFSYLNARDKWLYFGYYLGSIKANSTMSMTVEADNPDKYSYTNFFFDDITFFTVP